MIEAVNSVLVNAQILRGNTEQTAAEQAPEVVSSQEGGEITVPKAPFVSPFIAVDLDSNTAVLQIRDSDTGDVITQFPSESRIAELRQQEASQTTGETQGGSDSGNPVPVSDVQINDVAQSQVASQALATGAQAGVENLSAGVSVVA